MQKTEQFCKYFPSNKQVSELIYKLINYFFRG